MFGFPTEIKYLKAPLLFVALVFILELLKPASATLLGFLPQHISDGQWWRVITGQMLHTNLNHTLLNVAGIALLWALHGEYYTTKHYFFVVLVSLILVGIPLVFIYSETHYAGLSGIIHALLIYGASIDIRNRINSGWLIFVGVWAKALYEIYFGSAMATSELIEARVAVEAHLAGVISGTLMGLGYMIYTNKTKKGS